MVYESASGTVCANGHGGAPLVDSSGARFEPFPDAAFPEAPDPRRMQTLEAKVTQLGGQLAQARRALRNTMRVAFPLSDRGTAPWYQEAARALGSATDE